VYDDDDDGDDGDSSGSSNSNNNKLRFMVDVLSLLPFPIPVIFLPKLQIR
jgi:hypothetical protein